ncbi:MFS transporter [Desulfosporosinus sp. SB140]|uniref:MFS transporter n=1 Tax=Desulfosporosinus paludis TaxID=3115649 RepID=UPI003890783A
MQENRKNSYYGWYIVLAASLITLLTVGFRLGVGPFVIPMMKDLGISRTQFSLIAAVSALMYGLGMPLAGFLIKRYSTRSVLLVGMVIVCGSLIWTILAKSEGSLLLSFGILLSIGLSFLSPVAMTPIISRWFVRQRGKALFYLSSGSMAGIAIMTPLETMLIEAWGWHKTLWLFAGLFIVIVVPCALFVMRDDVPEGADRENDAVKPDKTVKGIDGRSSVNNLSKVSEMTWRDAVGTKAYWQIVLGLFTCGFSMNLLGSQGVPMLVDHHFDPMTASFGIGIIGIVAIFSTLLLGSIADRYERKIILFWIYLVRGLGFLGLVLAATPWQLYSVGVAGGLVWAGSTAMSSAILSDLYGTKLLGLLYGWAYFGHQIGGAIGTFLGGWGYETFGTHFFAFGLTTLLLLMASWISYRLPARSSRWPMEEKGASLG